MSPINWSPDFKTDRVVIDTGASMMNLIKERDVWKARSLNLHDSIREFIEADIDLMDACDEVPCDPSRLSDADARRNKAHMRLQEIAKEAE